MTVSQHVTSSVTTHRLGQVCILAAVLGAASGIYLAAQTPVVPDDMWSYPQSPQAFTWTQVWFAVQHLGLVAGLVALWRSGAVGPTRLGRLGHLGAVTGILLLAGTEVLSINARYDATDTVRVAVIGAAYAVVSVVIGVALIAEGLATRRAWVWHGPRRFLPLAMGAWVFVPMIPALALSFVWARLAIAGWMVLFAALGWAVVDADRRAGRPGV